MSNDPTRQVHSATHPSGHLNKTPVNAENPIFGRPADPVVTEVSVEQAAVVQSDKAGRETVVSPLINESPATGPVFHNADGSTVGAEQAGSGQSSNADDWTKTKGAGLTADTSSESGEEYRHGSGKGPSKITPLVPVELPTQEQADAIVAEAKAEENHEPASAEA